MNEIIVAIALWCNNRSTSSCQDRILSCYFDNNANAAGTNNIALQVCMKKEVKK